MMTKLSIITWRCRVDAGDDNGRRIAVSHPSCREITGCCGCCCCVTSPDNCAQTSWSSARMRADNWNQFRVDYYSYRTASNNRMYGNQRHLNAALKDRELQRCLDSFDVEHMQINPLKATIKPHSNGPLYGNTIVGTLAVDGRAVTFGTARRGLGGLRPRLVPSSQM